MCHFELFFIPISIHSENPWWGQPRPWPHGDVQDLHEAAQQDLQEQGRVQEEVQDLPPEHEEGTHPAAERARHCQVRPDQVCRSHW